MGFEILVRRTETFRGRMRRTGSHFLHSAICDGTVSRRGCLRTAETGYIFRRLPRNDRKRDVYHQRLGTGCRISVDPISGCLLRSTRRPYHRAPAGNGKIDSGSRRLDGIWDQKEWLPDFKVQPKTNGTDYDFPEGTCRSRWRDHGRFTAQERFRRRNHGSFCRCG